MFRLLRIAAVVGTLAVLSPVNADGPAAPNISASRPDRVGETLARIMGGAAWIWTGLSPDRSSSNSPQAAIAEEAARMTFGSVMSPQVAHRRSGDTLAASDRRAAPRSDPHKAVRDEHLSGVSTGTPPRL